MEPGLYIVGTPIGNLQDISLRALETLREADAILAEDTRHTRKLLERHAIRNKLVSNHKFNEASRVDTLVGEIQAGKAVALVSDSGMPGISDPGSRAVRACREAGLAVTVIPGPCAVDAAVSLSGWGDGGFVFAGFLSNKGARRRRELEAFAEEKRAVVLYESPHRINKLLADIATVLGERPVFLARELTKKFEECVSGSAQDILDHFGERTIKGEIVVVIGS